MVVGWYGGGGGVVVMERIGNFDRANSRLSGANERNSRRVENPRMP